MSNIIHKGFSVLFSSRVIHILSKGVRKGLIKILKEHFTLSSAEMALNFQQSYVCAVAAISTGFAAKENQQGFLKSLFKSKLDGEFSQHLTVEYLQPFAAQQNLEGRAWDDFCDNALQHCQQLATLTLFDAEDCALSERELAEVISTTDTTSMTALLLALIEKNHTLPREVIACFNFKELLGNALLFFLYEQLRKEPRFQTTLSTLQAEGFSVDIKDIKGIVKASQKTLEQAFANGEYAKIADLGEKLTQLKQIDTVVTTHYDEFMAFQRQFDHWSQLLNLRLEQIIGALPKLSQQLTDIKDDTTEIKAKLQQLEAMLQQLMTQIGLSTQIKPNDEFSYINSTNQQLIKDAIKFHQQMPSSSADYTKISLDLGAVISSQGNAQQAEHLFKQAYQQATKEGNDDDRALSQFNLFQLFIRQQRYKKAFRALQIALALKPAIYALHNIHSHQITKILGAGGMGCVFLAEDRFIQKTVVIKCFWETLQGNADHLFQEAFLMAKIAGEYIPQPLSCGFVDPMRQRRGYFVAEYIDDAIDGEAWLTRHGAMELTTAVSVGLQVAKGLQLAHQQGIYHLDLKPANLLFQAQPEHPPTVKIIDFGLARIAPSRAEEMLAQRSRSGLSRMAQSTIFGTLDYAPPEQQGITRYGEPTAKSDLYAFAKTLYRLVSNESPQTLRPKYFKGNLAFYEMLCDCVEIDPQQRPDIKQLLNTLSGFLDRKITSKPPSEPTKETPSHATSSAVFIEPEMITIPEGEFIMGCQQGRDDVEGGCWDREKPAHRVRVGAFLLAKYSVTFAEFDAFCKATNMKLPQDQGWGRENRPVINVSWQEAQAYLHWLNQVSGRVYRLPSEAEWEYAARANSETAYPWGNKPSPTQANYDGKVGKTTPVGSYPANGFGLYDLHGNVWEWVQDKWHDGYQNAPTDGSAWESGGGTFRVFRGGSWSGTSRNLRSADRFWGTPDNRSSFLGFRLARSQDKSSR